MKAYIVVPYDIFPYYLYYECEDTGEKYKVCQGLYFSYSNVIKRLDKVEFDVLDKRTDQLKIKKRAHEKALKKEAEELLNLFK
jgi:hypothetical protein